MGTGLPELKDDYRDRSYLFEPGAFPMDHELLKQRLRRACLKLGDVETTVPAFLQSSFAPVAFISFDLDLYSSTLPALQVLEAPHDRLLPHIFCHFDDIMGYGNSAFTGERVAIAEFNEKHSLRKLSPLYGMGYFVPWQPRNDMWVKLLYMAHFFDHPLYKAYEYVHGSHPPLI